MDESQSFSTRPALPPRRKPAIGGNADLPLQVNEKDELPLSINEIDPELLAEFEQAVKQIGNEVIVDLSIQPKENTITAPILEDYIDPHTVPLQYLLEQARLPLKSEELSEDLSDNEAEENAAEE